jgi:hypothetical protein
MLVVVEDMENGEYNVFLMEVNLVHYCELIIGNSVIAPRCKQVDEFPPEGFMMLPLVNKVVFRASISVEDPVQLI